MIADGTVLGGRYVIEARLGEGGMGTVYRARHVDVGRPFAVKVLHSALVANPKVVQRFRREAELAGRLRHDHVVSVVDMGLTADHDQYLVMEYAPGTRLSDLMQDGPMAEARVLEIATQLCDGLQHAHDVGLIHRDFKPDNVIVEQLPGGREVARIVDFGVAILRDHAGNTEGERLTEKGLVVGTPHYMAPEQARGQGVDHRVDLFALGLLLYELLAGKPPFEGDGVDVARANLHMVTPLMGVRAPGVKVDPVLEALVRKLLSKKPDDRLPSAAAVGELLDLYMRNRADAAALLGVRDHVIESGGMPALHQASVVGRSRSANHSATPYQHLLSQQQPPLVVEAPASPRQSPRTDEVPAPRRGTRRFVVITAVVAAVLVLLVVSLSRSVTTTSSSAPELAAGEPEPHVRTEQSATEDPREGEELPGDQARPPVGPRPLPQSRTTSIVITSPDPPSANEIASLYAAVGRELTAASRTNADSTTDLWPRYRWIRLMDAMSTPAKRSHTKALLERLRADLKAALTPKRP